MSLYDHPLGKERESNTPLFGSKRNFFLVISLSFLFFIPSVYAGFWVPWQGVIEFKNSTPVTDADLTINVSEGGVNFYNETFVNQLRSLPGNRSGFDVVIGQNNPFNFFYNRQYNVCFSVENESQGCFDWKPGLGLIEGAAIANHTITIDKLNLTELNNTIDQRVNLTGITSFNVSGGCNSTSFIQNLTVDENNIVAVCREDSLGGGGGTVEDVWINESGDTLNGDLTLNNSDVGITDGDTRLYFENNNFIVEIFG